MPSPPPRCQGEVAESLPLPLKFRGTCIHLAGTNIQGVLPAPLGHFSQLQNGDARDAEGRSVALKLLLVEGAATSRRFAREAEAVHHVSMLEDERHDVWSSGYFNRRTHC